MSWPDTREDGYKHVIGKDITGGDFWESKSGVTPASCKAVCNSNSRCKSFVFKKTDGGVCFLNTLGESAATTVDTNIDAYYKQGEPANDKHIFLTDTSPVSSWRDNGLYDREVCINSEDDCDGNSKKVGNRNEKQGNGSVCLGIPDWSKVKQTACTWMPTAANMCPDIGETPEDLVYFRHTKAASGKVENYDYGQRYDDNWSTTGNNLSLLENNGITCGYNRIKKDKWADLVSKYGFTEDEKKRVIKEHCEGPGVTSKELAADSTYCGDMMIKTEYNQAILNKLKTQSNWWTDATNCINFENVVVGSTSDQAVMRIAGEIIDSIVFSSDEVSVDFVQSMNSIKTNSNVPKNIKTKIDEKIEKYCDSFNGTSNPKCGCRNAVKFGKAKACLKEIEGCEDVKRAQDLIDKVTKIDASFGRTIASAYDPNFDSDACKSSLVPTSDVLNVGDIQIRNYDIAACFTEIDNSGTITGDVSTKCNAAVSKYNADQASRNSSSNNKDEDEDEDGSILKGETAGIKNDYWIIGLVLCCLCFLIIGVGLAAVLI